MHWHVMRFAKIQQDANKKLFLEGFGRTSNGFLCVFNENLQRVVSVDLNITKTHFTLHIILFFNLNKIYIMQYNKIFLIVYYIILSCLSYVY